MSIHPYDSAAFEAALDYLYSFINFEQRPQDRYMASKLDADRPRQLMTLLGDPHRQYPTLHIAGTKGKGSVAAMCASVLRAAGLRVGLYTSPHLQDFRERIRILTPDDADGRIPPPAFVTHIEQLKPIVAEMPDITWFEILTAVAFNYFAQAAVDIAVIEVGLGGRLDATNVVTPLVSVITSLSLDHTKLLGNTLADIAYEKGGIIKRGVPVVVAPQEDEARHKLVRLAVERQAPLIQVGVDWQGRGEPNGAQTLVIERTAKPAFIPTGAKLPLSLLGSHQLENALVAVAALAQVRRFFPLLTADVVRQGLATVSWPGRLQYIHQAATTPDVLLDCAHNPHSAVVLGHALTTLFQYDRLILVFGAPADKDVRGVLTALLPLAARAIMTVSNHPRAAQPADLAAMAAGLGYGPEQVATAATIAEAFAAAWQVAKPDDLICITGSIVVVGDFLNQWHNLREQFVEAASTAVEP